MRRSEPVKKSTFRAKLVTSTILLAGLIAAFVYWIIQRPTKVPLIALGVTNYESDLVPPNSWTAEDLDRLQEQFDVADNGLLSSFTQALPGQVAVFHDSDANSWGERDDWAETALEELDQKLRDRRITPGGPGKDTILLYISAHGVVNENNRPCVLLTGSNPVKSKSWLPLKDVLEKVCKIWPSTTGKRVNKLVVLDCNRLEANGSCGLLYNNFAEQLEDLVRHVLDKETCRDLVVLNSTAPNQIGWAAPELGGSVFGYYFCQGLGGTGKADADADGKVRLSELANFLQERVGRWVTEHRQGFQSPMLYRVSGDDDFALADCGSGIATQERRDREKERRDAAFDRWNRAEEWKAVDALWKQHDALAEANVNRFDPLKWAWFERNLLRLEQLLVAGRAYEEEAGKLRGKLDEWVKDDQSKHPQDLADFSLPLAELDLQQRSNPDVSGASKNETPNDSKYLAEARKYWKAADKDLANRTALRTALDKIIRAPGRGAADVVEIHFLRMLSGGVDPSGNPALVARAVRSRDLAERAATPGDERAFWWARTGIDAAKADERRRRAEDLLLVGPPTAPAARSNWEDYENKTWDASDKGYRDAAQSGGEVAKAFELRDRGWAQAPYLAQWLWSERIAARGNEEQWKRLHGVLNRLHELSSALDEEIATGAPDNLRKKQDTGALEDDTGALVADFRTVGKQLRDEGDHQENLVKIERHLTLPLVPAQDRKTLRDIYLKILQEKYTARLVELDRPEGEAVSADGSAAKHRAAEEQGFAPSLGGFRNHPLVDLLNVEWLKVNEGKPAAIESGGDEPVSPADVRRELARQGGEVRSRLLDIGSNSDKSLKDSKDELTAANQQIEANPKELTAKKIAAIRRGRSQADRLVRAAAALRNPAPTDPVDPTLELRKFDLHQLMIWHCQRTLDDFWGSADPKDTSNSYFAIVAGEYLGKAARLCPEAESLRAHCEDLRKKRVAAAAALLGASSGKTLIVDEESPKPVELKLSVSEPAPNLPKGIAAAYVRYQDATSEEPVRLTRDRNPKRPPGAWIQRIGIPLEDVPDVRSLAIVEQNPGSSNVGYWVDPPSKSRSLEAVVDYRGHQRKSTIRVSPPGVQIAYKPDRPDAPSVTVHGDEKSPTSVMFIFDCSGSMYEEDFPREGKMDRRINGARDTLIRILEDPSLAQFRVGMRIYGHRFGVDKATKKILPSPFAKAEKAAALKQNRPFQDLHPGEDVELVHPIGVLRDEDRREMIDTLNRLLPWGATPLYLSIADALGDAKRPDEVRRIIVITDGFNQQENVPLNHQKTAKALEQDFKGHSKVTLDIIGFGQEIGGKLSADQTNSLNDMKRIAAANGGQFYRADTTSDLLKHLQDSLRSGKFEVVREVPAGRPREQAERYDLEKTWQEDKNVRDPSDPPQSIKYDVRVVEIESQSIAPMPIVLDGGEALELFLDRSRLVYHRYDPDNLLARIRSASGEISDANLNRIGRIVTRPSAVGENPQKYWVAARIPERNPDDSATFFISIQDYNLARFSRRPVEAWIEIAPIPDNSDPPKVTYRYCDLNFSNGAAVPELRCVAPKFPHDTCKAAQIELWFKFDSTPPDAIRTVAQLKTPAPNLAASAEVVENIDEQESIAVRVEVSSDADKPGLVAAKVEMDPRPVRPWKIEHDYDTGRHTFFYEKGTSVEQVDQLKARITSLEKLKRDAYSCPLPERTMSR